MKATDVVGYAYDASLHCAHCAMLAGADKPGATDSKGDECRPIFPADVDDGDRCDDCNELLEVWRTADVMLYLSDIRGIYIPQHFAEDTKRECVTGIDDDDWNVLLAGPDHELFWEAWENVCNHATVTDPDTGKEYTIYQDGDCWLVEKGAEWDDRVGLDGARIRI